MFMRKLMLKMMTTMFKRKIATEMERMKEEKLIKEKIEIKG